MAREVLENEEDAIKMADKMTKRDLKDGIQTVQYQINTLMSTNGQSPFVTLFMHIEDGDEYEKETAMIVEEILKQRIEGIKNEAGVYVTPAFPKLIYVLDENNVHSNSKYYYLTELAAKCTAKRMYPDYISAKKMKELYEGNVFSPMGCVKEDETVKVFKDKESYSLNFKRLWEKMSNEYPVVDQETLSITKDKDNDYSYIDLQGQGYKIFDSRNNKYADIKKLIRNRNNNVWYEIKFTKEKSLIVTEEHPFTVIRNGKEISIQAKDLQKGDQINKAHGSLGDISDCDVLDFDKYVSVVNIEIVKAENEFSYDFETSTSYFDVSGVTSHNCRSFLSPWKNEDGEYQFEGRFNIGVVSLNLPQIAILADHNEEKFWEILDKRLELAKKALLLRYDLVKDTPSDVAPILWQHGAIARLKPGETINNLLVGGYATLSLGYIGIYEATKLIKGTSHTKNKEFALEIIKKLRESVDAWKEETNIGFALYGTPRQHWAYIS